MTFWGQANRTNVLTFANLAPPPVVAQVKTDPPSVPRGLKVVCSKGPDTLDQADTCPVVQWGGYVYWAFSYIDNRSSMAIVAFDSTGKAVQRWNKTGARYVWKITVSTRAKNVVFYGQSNSHITMTWSEMRSSGS